MKNKDDIKNIEYEHEHCCCEESHNHEENIEDLICDLDDTKICDNCMKCLNSFNTDKNGYVSIGIDGVDAESGLSLNDLYKMYGLDGDD